MNKKLTLIGSAIVLIGITGWMFFPRPVTPKNNVGIEKSRPSGNQKKFTTPYDNLPAKKYQCDISLSGEKIVFHALVFPKPLSLETMLKDFQPNLDFRKSPIGVAIAAYYYTRNGKTENDAKAKAALTDNPKKKFDQMKLVCEKCRQGSWEIYFKHKREWSSRFKSEMIALVYLEKHNKVICIFKRNGPDGYGSAYLVLSKNTDGTYSRPSTNVFWPIADTLANGRGGKRLIEILGLDKKYNLKR